MIYTNLGAGSCRRLTSVHDKCARDLLDTGTTGNKGESYGQTEVRIKELPTAD
jgi:hypothetical protein